MTDRQSPFLVNSVRGLVFFGLVAAAAGINWGYPGKYGWLATVVILMGLLVLIGYALNGRPAGIVIDNRNRVSLSKLQATAWTVLALSGLFAAAAWNLRLGSSERSPLDIDIPIELLAAMAISATSLVATPALLSLKTGQEPTQAELQDAASVLPSHAVGEITSAGKIFGRSAAEDASWFDLFRGDEVSNVDSPDLSKVQQFLITLILLGVYAAALWASFSRQGPSAPILTLPDFSERFVWLMGISHTGYLAYKAAPHGRSTSGDAAALVDPRNEAAG